MFIPQFYIQLPFINLSHILYGFSNLIMARNVFVALGHQPFGSQCFWLSALYHWLASFHWLTHFLSGSQNIDGFNILGLARNGKMAYASSIWLAGLMWLKAPLSWLANSKWLMHIPSGSHKCIGLYKRFLARTREMALAGETWLATSHWLTHFPTWLYYYIFSSI